MKTAVTTLTLLALAGLVGACSGADAPLAANNMTNEDVAPANDAGIVAPAANGNAAAADEFDPVILNASNADEEGDLLASFPVAFQGRWGMNANDCDPARGDAKGLITISVDRIKFYESVARPVELTLSGRKLLADLSFTGEGQSWKNRTMFELIGSGGKLVRSEEAPATVSYAYTKCAA